MLTAPDPDLNEVTLGTVMEEKQCSAMTVGKERDIDLDQDNGTCFSRMSVDDERGQHTLSGYTHDHPGDGLRSMSVTGYGRRDSSSPFGPTFSGFLPQSPSAGLSGFPSFDMPFSGICGDSPGLMTRSNLGTSSSSQH